MTIKSPHPTRLLSLGLFALALTAIAVPAEASSRKQVRAGKTTVASDFVKVATHPQAAAQPTATGKTIATLKAWNGKLYSGYGDYNDNTGPIAITPLTGGAFEGSAVISDTEAVWRYRAIGGKLYAPSIDPRVSSDFAVGGGASGWLNETRVRASHAYDIVTRTGSDLWIVGSQGMDAVAWRSLDGGSTWVEQLRVPPKDTASGDFARFYGAGVVAGRLYVQAAGFYGGRHAMSKVFDGTGWADGPSMPTYFSHAESFGGKMLAHGSMHSGHSTGFLFSFDGTRSTLAYGSSIWDYTIEAGTVYVLGTDRKVMASPDLVSWTQVGTAPSQARSVGVMDGRVYLGGTDSAIYRK